MSSDRSTAILLALARERDDEAARLLESGPPDAEAFIDLCVQTDIEPWLHWRIERAGLAERFDERVAAHLAARRHKTRVDNLLLVAVAERTLAILDAAGVRSLGLKGIDLLHRVYPSIDLRTATDLDLLIPREELRTALEALGAAGYRAPDPDTATHYVRSSHHLPIDSPGPVTVGVELHWNLVQDFRYDLDPEGLFERARPLRVGPRTTLRLDEVDFVAHLLLHHLSHYFNRQLKWLIDLRQVVHDGFDWTAVADRLREWGGSAAGAVAARHLNRLDPATVGPEALDALPLAAWRRALTLPFRSTRPLDWVRGADRRWLQLYLAAVHLEHPSRLPRWLLRRRVRDRVPGDHPLDTGDARVDIPARSGKTDGGERPRP